MFSNIQENSYWPYYSQYFSYDYTCNDYKYDMKSPYLLNHIKSNQSIEHSLDQNYHYINNNTNKYKENSFIQHQIQWKMAFDKRTGRPYYYHPYTRETSWVNPNKNNLIQNKEINNIKPEVLEDTKQKQMTNDFFKHMENNICSKLNNKNSHNLYNTINNQTTHNNNNNNNNKSFISDKNKKLFRTISSNQDNKILKLIENNNDISKDHLIINENDINPCTIPRKRSNSTSSIYLRNGTMSKPDEKLTMYSVCTVIRAHIKQSKKYLNQWNNDKNNKTFHLYLLFNNTNHMKIHTDIPSVETIYEYMYRIYKKSKMEPESIIMNLIYIEKLLLKTNGKLVLNKNNWQGILFISMVLASKIWDDLSMDNNGFSKICIDFPLNKLNELELAYLSIVQYDIGITATSYAKYYFNIRTICYSIKKNKKNTINNESNHINIIQKKNSFILSVYDAKILNILHEDEDINEKDRNNTPENTNSNTIQSLTPRKDYTRRYTLFGDYSTDILEDYLDSGYKLSNKKSPSASIEQLVRMEVKKAGEQSK